MDIYAQTLTGLTARLNADAFLSAGVIAEVIREEPLVDDTADDITSEAHRKEVNDKLNARGVIGIASIPELVRVEGDRFLFRGLVEWFVNKVKNKAAGGAQKPGHLCVIHTAAALHRHRISILNDSAVACQSLEIMVTNAEYVGEEGGTEVWAVEYETLIRIN